MIAIAVALDRSSSRSPCGATGGSPGCCWFRRDGGGRDQPARRRARGPRRRARRRSPTRAPRRCCSAGFWVQLFSGATLAIVRAAARRCSCARRAAPRGPPTRAREPPAPRLRPGAARALQARAVRRRGLAGARLSAPLIARSRRRCAPGGGAPRRARSPRAEPGAAPAPCIAAAVVPVRVGAHDHVPARVDPAAARELCNVAGRRPPPLRARSCSPCSRSVAAISRSSPARSPPRSRSRSPASSRCSSS